MTTAALSPAGPGFPEGSVRVTLSSYSATCIPTIWYRIGGAAEVQLGSNPGSFVISEQGTTVVAYRAVDLSNNVETLKTVDVHVAAHSLTVSNDAKPSYDGTAVVQLSATGAESGIARFEVRLDNEPTQTVPSGSIALSTAAAGPHVIRYYVADGLKRSASGEVAFTVAEPVVPSVSLVASPRAVIYPSIVTLRAVASHAETDVARFQVQYESDPKWYDIGTVKTAAGTFLLLHVPMKKAYYRVSVGSAESTSSAIVLVSAGLGKPRISPNTSTVKVGRKVRLSGTIRPFHSPGTPPADVKYRLTVEKYDRLAKKWRASVNTPWQVKNAINSDTSEWVYERTFRASDVGSWRIRFFHECPRHKSAYSPWTPFVVVR